MKLNELRNIGVAELTALKAKQDVATKESAAIHADNTEASRIYAIALRCAMLGIWIGEEVQITGKAGGKENPTGQLAGFEYPESSYSYPLVYLRKKDGKLSDNTTRLYSCNKIAPLGAAGSPAIEKTPQPSNS